MNPVGFCNVPLFVVSPDGAGLDAWTPGDFNLDGVVDLADVLLALNAALSGQSTVFSQQGPATVADVQLTLGAAVTFARPVLSLTFQAVPLPAPGTA